MKWKRGAAEYLTEKTFLVIKDDLAALRGKSAKDKLRGITKASDTGTWPPKMKKIASLYDDGDRPKTANLEKPNILNPKLIDKLDMSLLSKELLCESMTRIQLSKETSGGSLSIPSSSKRRQSPAVIGEPPPQTSTVTNSASGVSERHNRKSSERLSESKSSHHDIPVESPRMEKQTRIPLQDSNSVKKLPLDNKKLDDNNNRNGTNGVSKIPALSNVKKKSSRTGLPADFEVFTASTSRSAPEPCKACGRPDQPERFHSHPKGAIIKPKDSPSTPKFRNAVPKSIQKPIALNFRSDKNKNKPEELDVKPKCALPNERIKEESNQLSRPSSAPIKRGPKTVTCYICGRDFGTASFPIHEPRCMEKWERENNALPVNQRRPTPQRPGLAIDHLDWNSAAWEASQAQLIPCLKCGRTFLPDRLPVHQKSCKAIPKEVEPGKAESSVTIKPSVNSMKQGPPTILCKVCGRSFGTRSIKIHEPQCIRRWQIENNNQSVTQWRKQSSAFGQRVEKNNSINSRDFPSVVEAHKRSVTCYICGRDFGSTSIAIHEPQCLRKWQIENDKLPENQRRAEPQKPDMIYNHDENSGTMVIDLTAMAEASWKSHLSQLIPCKKCGRTFNPDRVAVHERSCKGSR